MPFITYENYNNPHVTIHAKECTQIKKRGGHHRYAQAKYEEHQSYEDALNYARSTRLDVRDCSFCKPDLTAVGVKESVQHQATPIFLTPTAGKNYTKITLAPGERRNIGCIEHDGHLNVKRRLLNMIKRAGGNFLTAPGYHESQSGKTHGVAGVNYHSHAEFPNPAEVERYLANYFRVTHADGPNALTTSRQGVPEAEEISVIEGRRVLRIHLSLERDRTVVALKKSQVLAETGRLECEVCGFDFAAVYGEIGEGFAEGHHIQPLALTVGERATTPSDLSIVCANCHRMLHKHPWHTVSELRELLTARKNNSYISREVG